MVQTLLDKGAKPNLANRWGETPIFDAVEFGHKDTVQLLLHRGADPNIANYNGSGLL